MRFLTCCAIVFLFASATFASDYKIAPSVEIGGITELGNSFDPFYKFRLEATTPAIIGPLALEAGAAVSTYQLPYYLAPGGQNSPSRKRQLVDEWKIDYNAAAVYSFDYDEVTYQVFGGAGGVYIDNKVVSFTAVGPMAGFRANTTNDWGKALVAMDITPYLASQATYATAIDSFAFQGSTINTSVFGKPVLSVGYKVLFSIPSDAGYEIDYALDGQMIKFDRSYRYYNGLAVAIRF